MIGTLLRIGWIAVRRDRVVQLLTFVVPVFFFSVFALVFGNMGRGGTPRIRVAVVDEDKTETSRRLVAALRKEPSLRVRTTAAPGGAPSDSVRPPLDRARAEALVRAGDVPVAIIVPRGFGETFGAFDRERPVVQLLADTGDPVAPQMVGGLLQKAAMTATPDVVAGRGIAQFERYAGKLTPQQRKAVDEWLPLLRRRSSGLAAADSAAGGAGDSAVSGAGSPQVAGPGGMLETKVVDVLGEQKKNPVIAFYAAGIAVMFLLFSASGAGGSLLDEVESGTLERLLSSNARMGRLLLGKGLFIMLLGVLQVTVMFVWGALGFNLDLLGHLPGFAVMTIATAAAASGLGLLLATACRTRAQLGGIATLVILSMSALGGSMVPRFLMSEGMQRVGLVTFNAWALDGYVKVFWREAPIVALWPQVAVLLGMALGFFGLARLLARRWESV